MDTMLRKAIDFIVETNNLDNRRLSHPNDLGRTVALFELLIQEKHRLDRVGDIGDYVREQYPELDRLPEQLEAMYWVLELYLTGKKSLPKGILDVVADRP